MYICSWILAPKLSNPDTTVILLPETCLICSVLFTFLGKRTVATFKDYVVASIMHFEIKSNLLEVEVSPVLLVHRHGFFIMAYEHH